MSLMGFTLAHLSFCRRIAKRGCLMMIDWSGPPADFQALTGIQALVIVGAIVVGVVLGSLVVWLLSKLKF